MPRTQLIVVSAGISEESATNRLAEAMADAVVRAAGDTDLEVVRINLRDLVHEIATASVTGFAAGALESAYDALGVADAIIAVSPTYKASYTGIFKAFWDVSPDGVIAGVPVLLGATGGSPRHSLVTEMAMRPLFSYMRALTVPTSIYTSAQDWADSGFTKRLEIAASEVVQQWGVTRAPHVSDQGDQPGEAAATETSPLAQRRDRARDPFSNVPTMDQMLR